MKNILFITFLVMLFTSAGYSQTIAERVPAWAKEAVWYQIFPERFSNGDTANDPQPVDMKGAWPYFVPDGWRIHPWTSDWYKLQPWEKANGHDFYWNAGVRRYGGDLQGVINKLDYLQNLGITAIYFNPLFESPSLHKYDASMYRHIDNNFGPDPAKDREIWAFENPADPQTWKFTTADSLFLKLLEEAHKRNIRVIIDGVFNHVGTTFWAFQDVVKNQETSKYKDWFYIESFDDPATEANEFEYRGWYGVKDLPEIREDENGLVEGPKRHIFAIVKRWMDPNGDGDPSDGIDGWRLDVAEMVNHNFWKDFRIHVKKINPEAYIVGEVWWEDWTNNVMFNAAPWLKGDQFDAVMNYRFVRALKHFVIDEKNNCGAQGFVDSLKNQYRDYDKENLYVLMNLLGSHDAERLASLIRNPDGWYDHYANPQQNKDFDVSKPDLSDRAKQKLIVGMQMTLPGAPHIYYGDEAGMWGGDDPDDRKPMVWREFKYETETTHPYGKKRPADKVAFDEDLFAWYRQMIDIRKENKPLSLGTVEFKVIDNGKGILAYKREYEGDTIFIIVNNSNEKNSVEIEKNDFLSFGENAVDMVSGETIKTVEGKLSLSPYQILIIRDIE